MTDLKNARLTDCIPRCLAELPEISAMSYAIGQQTEKLIAMAEKVRTYSAIDALSGDLLDAVALEMNVPRYSVSLTVEQKRTLIKGTIYYRTHAGTVAAVEDLCSAIFGDAKVTEWFDYGAAPGMYKISTTNPAVTEDNVDDFRAAALSVARKSQHLDTVELLLSVSADLMSGIVSRSAGTETMICSMQ